MNHLRVTGAVAAALLLTGIGLSAPANADVMLSAHEYGAPRLAADEPRRQQRSRQRQRQADSVERSKSVTRNGKTRERSMRRDVDREQGRVTTERSATGPNGRSATADTVLQRTDDGFERNTVVTGPRGQTATRDTDVSYDPETGLTRDRVTTRPNGDQVLRHDQVQVDRDAQTYSRQSSRTGANGNTATADVSASRTETGAERTITRTAADGRSVTRTQSVERSDDADADTDD